MFSSLFRLVLLVPVLVFTFLNTTASATCTPEALLALDLTLCSMEIRSQYDWRFNSSFDDPITCEPWNIVIVHDTSKTVRRSIQYGEKNFLEPLQSLYVKTFFDVFEPAITNDTMAYVTFATQPYTYIDFNELPIHSEFLEKALDWVNDPFYSEPFFTGGHQGWTDMSNAMIRLQELLGGRTDPENTLVILMSDGHPENRGSPELEETVVQADILRSLVNGKLHIHCLVMRFDEESQIFWRDERLCDSKELITTVPGVKPHKLVDNLDYWAQRSEICNSTDITSAPTSSPTLQFPCPDSEGMQDLPTIFLAAEFDEANVTVNNLCGSMGDPIIRYTDIFATRTLFLEDYSDIDIILECNKILSPGYDIVNDLTPVGGDVGVIQLRNGLSLTFTIKFVNATTGLPFAPPGIGLRLFDIDRDSAGRNETIVVCGYDKQVFTTLQGNPLPPGSEPISGGIRQVDNMPSAGCTTLTSLIQDVTDPTSAKYGDFDATQRSVTAEFIFRTSEITLTFSYGDSDAPGMEIEDFLFAVSLDSQDCINNVLDRTMGGGLN